jgi:hypothetical protein
MRRTRVGPSLAEDHWAPSASDSTVERAFRLLDAYASDNAAMSRPITMTET